MISAEGAGLRRLTEGAIEEAATNRPGMWQPSWSADGKWIYFTSDRTGRFEIWRMLSIGGRAEQLTHNGGSSAFPSRDNQWVYYQQAQRAPLRRIRPDGSADQVVINDPVDELQYTAIRPGMYFVVSSEQRSGLRRLSADGRVDDVLKLPFVPGLGLSLSEDARYVLVTKPDEKGTDLMLVEGFR